MRNILLNPGPVNVSDRVRRALLGPDLCHREPEFFDLQDAIRDRLLQLQEETVARRIARYARASAVVRDGLEALGFELLLPPDLRSTTMTAVRLPANLGYARLHDELKRDGFVIYAGQGPLAATLFRVATMGDVSDADYGRFVQSLGMCVARA